MTIELLTSACDLQQHATAAQDNPENGDKMTTFSSQLRTDHRVRSFLFKGTCLAHCARVAWCKQADTKDSYHYLSDSSRGQRNTAIQGNRNATTKPRHCHQSLIFSRVNWRTMSNRGVFFLTVAHGVVTTRVRNVGAKRGDTRLDTQLDTRRATSRFNDERRNRT